MELTRRRALLATGGSLSGAIAGCLADADPDDDADPGGVPSPGGGSGDRVDEPPYEITEPECTGGQRDPLWLCESVASEPSLPFDQESTSGSVLEDGGLRLETEDRGSQFYATFLTDEGDLDRLREDTGGPAVELIGETDFERDAVLVVQTGWGSGTVRPHLKRIEETDDGVHAVGCYRRPCGGTDDVTVRTVAARFERPPALASGTVSLTVDPDTRVHFEVGEGVVTVQEA